VVSPVVDGGVGDVGGGVFTLVTHPTNPNERSRAEMLFICPRYGRS
jgi:hypothetical protein